MVMMFRRMQPCGRGAYHTSTTPTDGKAYVYAVTVPLPRREVV